MQYDFLTLEIYMLVFARTSGMFLVNPLMVRRNVPTMAKAALLLGLTLLVAPHVNGDSLVAMHEMDKILTIVKEMLIGAAAGMVFNLFYYMLAFTGDFIDTQMGLAMAKTFDPSSNIQMSITSTMLTAMLVFYFFISDSHLTLIYIFANSFELVPLGGIGMTFGFAEHLINLFLSVFTLAFKLTLPFIAAEFTIEVALGILMRLIPQIHVFVISMQIRLLVGLMLMIAFAHPISAFIDRYMLLMVENTYQVFKVAFQ